MELLNSIPHYVRDAFGLTAAAMYLPKRKEVYRTGVDHPELSEDQLESVSGRGELVVDEERAVVLRAAAHRRAAGGQHGIGRRSALARDAGGRRQPDRHFDRARRARWRR